MPNLTAADTIRILVATDNHVGYNERDPIRGDDSWLSFHEIMTLAKDRDVDMVLLAGDLFHENKPSQKSLYNVMRSLRMNCYGEKPCELEMLSDGSEAFAGAFNHVNYEDPDVNVAIPVFTIHGNHDDPSGPGHFTPLDLLQMSGLVNYYGRTPESDNIHVKPVLLQKGQTKLALYGLSNVRDERLFRTFRDGNVKFFQPGTQKSDWFNLISVHQNRHAHTETNYLPEHFLPDFMDLVIWGHEHECRIEPELNPETNFRVLQPGSSVATSLIKSESQPKHVAIISVTGKEFVSEPIRLKTVRPFIYDEVVIQDDKTMRNVAFEDDNATKVHTFLIAIIEKLIDQANKDWKDRQREARRANNNTSDDEEEDPNEEAEQPPLPLIRLRIDHTAPQGGAYNIDNPQRFSNRFSGRVANTGDVVSYHRKRQTTTSRRNQADMPEEEIMAQITVDNAKIGKLVEEFLAAQSLTILPQNEFSDAVGQFVDKDDNTALANFLTSALDTQVSSLLAAGGGDADDDEDGEGGIEALMEKIKEKLEVQFEKGELKRVRRSGKLKPRPEGWDDEIDGLWEENPAAWVRETVEGNGSLYGMRDDDEDEEGDSTPAPPAKSGRGGRGGRGRGRGGKAATTAARGRTAAAKKAPAKPAAKSRRKPIIENDEDEDEEDDDVIMLDDDDDDDDEGEDEEDESQGLFITQASTSNSKSRSDKPAAKTTSKSTTTTARQSAASKALTTRGGARSAASRQTQISFPSSQVNGTGIGSSGVGRTAGGRGVAGSTASGRNLRREPSEDEISDDDDAFEPPSTLAGRRGR